MLADELVVDACGPDLLAVVAVVVEFVFIACETEAAVTKGARFGWKFLGGAVQTILAPCCKGRPAKWELTGVENMGIAVLGSC